MTKYDYLSKLKAYLHPLPAKERNAALRYYDKYFTDAGPENEYNVITKYIIYNRYYKIITKGGKTHEYL